MQRTVAVLALAATIAALVPAPAAAQFYQCVAYAREATGVAIRGNANTWWNQAQGRYDRGSAPRPGAILAFKAERGMPAGHVAVVAEVVSPRELLLDHANWSRRGRVEHGVRAIDVSDAGDWSSVRVWYGRTGDMGTRTNPTFGFIYPGSAPAAVAARPQLAASADLVELAAAEQQGG